MGRMEQGQSPGAGHDGAGGRWLRRRSAGGIALASAGFHDDLFAGLFEGRYEIQKLTRKSQDGI